MADVPMSDRPNRTKALGLMKRRTSGPAALQHFGSHPEGRPFSAWADIPGEEDVAAAKALDQLDRLYGQGATDE